MEIGKERHLMARTRKIDRVIIEAGVGLVTGAGLHDGHAEAPTKIVRVTVEDDAIRKWRSASPSRRPEEEE